MFLKRNCIVLIQSEGSGIQVLCPIVVGQNPLVNGCSETDQTIVSSQSFARTFSIQYTIPWFVVVGCAEILFVKRSELSKITSFSDRFWPKQVVVLHDGSKLLSRILVGLLVCELLSALTLLFLFTFFQSLSTGKYTIPNHWIFVYHSNTQWLSQQFLAPPLAAWGPMSSFLRPTLRTYCYSVLRKCAQWSSGYRSSFFKRF